MVMEMSNPCRAERKSNHRGTAKPNETKALMTVTISYRVLIEICTTLTNEDGRPLRAPSAVNTDDPWPGGWPMAG
jgi:hypothetical protein